VTAAADPPFRKLLVANRGEIAVRVIRACRDLGIRSVAVYSDVDRLALHVLEADEAYAIGAAPSSESYLRIDRILEAAERSGAEAIHPGYGFLSENPAFARACRDAGRVFVGPPPEAMEAVGDKVRARDLMQRSGVPVVPGTPPLDGDLGTIARAAEAIGYPVLLKASAGGGGKGMRVVRDAGELASLVPQARGEARSAFGDDRIFLEKFLVRPRHIEVQVVADGSGACVHLGERECSIQRRHQKLIEESPSPVVDPDTRARIGELAVRAVRAAGYVNAGTVEFLRDDGGSFYFMEVNARLQVEHPVTEEVYGVDLVRLQIAIAAGASLPFGQESVTGRGHAIECRIVAEDSARNFLPSPGTIRRLRVPTGPGIRHDGGTYDGWTVPVHYDPLLAKLVAWGEDRDMAIRRMARALAEYRVEGPATCIEFHQRVLAHPAFRRGELHTGFLDEHRELLAPPPDPDFEKLATLAAAVAHARRGRVRHHDGAEAAAAGPSAWRWGGRRGWRS
jgi:acetyl-CoA carboxylase biotin carboxylase subunit